MRCWVIVAALVVAAVAADGTAPTTTPALMWSSALEHPATHSAPVPNVADALRSAASSAGLSEPLAQLGVQTPRLVLVFAEPQLTAKALALRSSAFAAVLPAARIEAPFTSGLAATDLASLPVPCIDPTTTDPAAAVAQALASSPEGTAPAAAAVVVLCVNAATAADAISAADAAARAAAQPYIALYTGIVEPPAPAAAASTPDPETTTIWTGPVLSFLFAAVLMLAIMWFALDLMFSLQTQGEVDVPKQKVI